MSNDDLMKELQQKILNAKKRVRVEHPQYDHKGTLQIAKGEYNLPFISVLQQEDTWMVVYHTKKIPPVSSLATEKNYLYGQDFYMRKVDRQVAQVISEGIKYVKNKPSYFCNYTCLYTFCELNKVDLEQL